MDGFFVFWGQELEQFIDYAVQSWGLIACERLDAVLEGAAIQDSVVKPFPFSLGSIFSPGDESFKEGVVLTLSIHPGVVVFGTGIRWNVGSRLYAGGRHALSV
eukprot:1136916-Pelagomonas_calceolata.AAC.1